MSISAESGLFVALFREGLQYMNVKKVEQALKYVAVTTPMQSYGFENPLVSFLDKKRPWFQPRVDSKYPPEKIDTKRSAINKITDLLLAQPQDWKSFDLDGNTLADRVLMSASAPCDDFNNQAKVVIAALYGSLSSGAAAFQPNLASIFRHIGDSLSRERLHEGLEQVFECVKYRLRHPESQIETLLELKHGEDVAAWVERLQLPALSALPAEDKNLKAAHDAFIESISSLSRGFGGDPVFSGDSTIDSVYSERQRVSPAQMQDLFKAVGKADGEVRHQRVQTRRLDCE